MYWLYIISLCFGFLVCKIGIIVVGCNVMFTMPAPDIEEKADRERQKAQLLHSAQAQPRHRPEIPMLASFLRSFLEPQAF